MKKEEKNTSQEQMEARPNRDAYKQAFSEDYPDMDFEDKETRYGKMLEDRQSLRSYRKSGAALNNLFTNNRWLAAMVQDLSENPDLNPIEWLADNGIDIEEVMRDEETRKKVSERVAQYQQKMLEDEQEDEQRQKNFEASWKALAKLGVDQEKATEMWNTFFTDIVDPALRGEVSADTWRLIQKAANYDTDIAQAKELAGMQARNEKMENKVKDFSNTLPPSLPQSGNQTVQQKPRKRAGFYDDLKEAGYY